MADGDPTLVNHGSFEVSGAALTTAVNALSAVHPILSGGAIYMIPIGFGQVQLLELKYDGAG